MSLPVQPPESDLLLPLPEQGEVWDPHTIHTHYFGFAVPEAAIGVFAYVRYQPAFPLSQGGVVMFQGLDNPSPADAAHCNYEMTMPWPHIEGNTIRTVNGLAIEFLELGRVARVSYASADDRHSFNVLQSGVTPLLARGHIVPGEEHHHGEPGRVCGGSEQFMRVTGELVLNGEQHTVNCHYPRDRSWLQIRKETQGGPPMPPVGWSPMYFDQDLIFNQISFESPDAEPTWAGLYDIPVAARTHHFAWMQRGDTTLDIVRVRRRVLEQQPGTFAALRQEVEAEDETGSIHRFTGEAIASCVMPAWPNVSFHDSVYRWTDERGRTTHATYQELWADRYQLGMKVRAR